MTSYVVLWNFTEQGLKGIRHTTERADVFKAQAEAHGITIKEYFWTTGEYDGVIILDAPGDEEVMRLVFLISSFGTLKAKVLRAFTGEEITRLLE